MTCGAEARSRGAVSRIVHGACQSQNFNVPSTLGHMAAARCRAGSTVLFYRPLRWHREAACSRCHQGETGCGLGVGVIPKRRVYWEEVEERKARKDRRGELRKRAGINVKHEDERPVGDGTSTPFAMSASSKVEEKEFSGAHREGGTMRFVACTNGRNAWAVHGENGCSRCGCHLHWEQDERMRREFGERRGNHGWAEGGTECVRGCGERGKWGKESEREDSEKDAHTVTRARTHARAEKKTHSA